MASELLPYLLAIIGFLIVHVLNGIKSEIGEIKSQISKIEGDLHSRVTDLDRRQQEMAVDIERRVSHIESRCQSERGR